MKLFKSLALALFSAVLLFVLVGCETAPTVNNPNTENASPIEPNPEQEQGQEQNPNPTPEPVKYTVSWYDESGTLLTSEQVDSGTIPSTTYTPADTAEWDKSLTGWSTSLNGTALSSIPAATQNVSYYAVVSSVKQQYTVSFNAGIGTAVSPIRKDYGASISAPTKPSADGHQFVSWCTDPELTDTVSWPIVLSGDITLYASWNEQVDITAFLSELLEGCQKNPLTYIPEPMRAGYSANLISQANTNIDYSSFVNVSGIPSNGFGEQWHMILDNLAQSTTFYNVLSVVEGLTATSVTAFNNYIDKNPGDTAHHSFMSGIYSVTIDYSGSVIYFVLDYTATIPVLGEQTVQIAMSMNTTTKDKDVRIQLGDPNALRYQITDDSYTFDLKYLGVRRAHFFIQENADQSVTGHINEFLTVGGLGINSAADFYIGNQYVSAVGNKADGIAGFTGYINEVYLADTGKLVGYEVRESLSAIQYNTLWFDLNHLNGISSIKYVEGTESTKAAFYINGLSSAWDTKKVGSFSPKGLSRRFDIEFKKQFFYTYDTATDSYLEVEMMVPMLFVQEENYSTLTSDVASVNSGVNLTVTLPSSQLQKILDDYDTLIDVFVTNKEEITAEDIITNIGTAKTWDD